MSTKLVMPSSHLILCRALFLLPLSLPSIRVFSNQSTLRMKWPKYWSFSFNISPSNEHLGLISFRMDWLDLLAVQGTLMSLLQHHSSKASILWCSAFFIVQLSHPYMTTGKTITLTSVDHNKLENSSRDGNNKPLDLSPEKSVCRSGSICMQVQLELNMEQQTGSKSGKEYVKAIYHHPVYLTYMQSIS